MAVRVGVIGVGRIGHDHIRRLTSVSAGAEVVAVTDVDAERARNVAAGVPGARVHPSGLDLIGADDVDAVVVASWGPTHEEYVLACLEAGTPVFCEKPLAPTGKACLRIVDAEVAAGRRLVQVGFMRRFDASYLAMKDVLDSGRIGNALMVHCAHRNPDVPPHYTPDMAMTDTAVHEFDIVRWLLDDEIAAITVHEPRPNRHGGDLRDPLFILLETATGALIDVETSVNIRYGYDIRAEVVGEDGTVELAPASPVLVRQGGNLSGSLPPGWEERFAQAYDAEIQQWLDAVASMDTGASAVPPESPTAWDGYAAAAVSEAGMRALRTGARVPVELAEKPGLYRTS